MIPPESRTILFFDSGIGGLSVIGEARILLPDYRFVYVIDSAAFPYGSWDEEALREHILQLFSRIFLQCQPLLCVIACNTASTLVLSDLRAAFPEISFVGMVPAIKPAAEQTRTGLVSVLATVGTVQRHYIKDLIATYAEKVSITLVGSKQLASLAEDYFRGHVLDPNQIRQEILPCFVEKEHKHTDIIVLACTHYPFLINHFRKVAPWPVDWLDPAEAVILHARTLLEQNSKLPHNKNLSKSDLFKKEGNVRGKSFGEKDIAWFTSARIDCALRKVLSGFGFESQIFREE